MGQLEFPLPYWDNVSETAKVNTSILFTGFTVGSIKLMSCCVFLLKELIRSMLEVEVDQRYTALQVLEHPWVTVSAARDRTHFAAYSFLKYFPPLHLSCCFLHPMQDEGVCENDHQLSVAGKIKKHFNTSPKVNDTTAGVSVISVSRCHRKTKAESDKAANKKQQLSYSRLIFLVSLCVQLDDSFSMQRSGSLDFYQHPAMYWIRYGRFPWRHQPAITN